MWCQKMENIEKIKEAFRSLPLNVDWKMREEKLNNLVLAHAIIELSNKIDKRFKIYGKETKNSK